MGAYHSDVEVELLIVGFETHTLAYEAWTHTAHLTVAAVYCMKYGDDALKRVRNGIQSLNATYGVEQTPTGGYHESLTRAWIRLVAAHLRSLPTTMGIVEQVNSVVESLSDKSILLRYYSRDAIMSIEARYGFVEPDLLNLP